MSKIYDALQKVERERAAAAERSRSGAPGFDGEQHRAAATMAPLGPSGSDEPIEAILDRAEAIVRFSGELERRIGESGIAGVGGLLELHEKLEAAVERVSREELDWTVDTVTAVAAQLESTLAQFRHLKSLKLLVAPS